MNALCNNNSQQEKQNAFWEWMALKYPLPFEEKMLDDTSRIISLVKSKGVEISNASILDIGCGTGIYTLPLAREAAMVTGLDNSETMIFRMKDVIASNSVQNVQAVKLSWKEADISALGFEKVFDITWISMSHAVQTRQDFEKMEKCAKKWCVYIGWGRKRKNVLMEEVYRLHGLHYGPPPGVDSAYDILTGSGKSPSLDYFETSWDWTGTTGETLKAMVFYIEMQGGRPSIDLIEDLLACHEQNGRISHTTYVEEGLMVWHAE
ncbi:MAG: class I SAM-dependent methyltransferase [Desulfobacteraceae bacterium]|nr:MAG: class I SAM-dependent methyltransferase [Desulfobacteraceae bacterium]